MNREIKDKWIKALRSNKYNQGKNCLLDKKTNTYCCLGVLCEIMSIPKKPNNISVPTEALFEYKDTIGIYALPATLKADLKIEKYTETLALMNDGLGDFEGNPKSFMAIADWIQKHIPVEN